jgi:hypothetical protein
VLVAYGRQAVAQVWALVIGLMASHSGFPRRRTLSSARGAKSMRNPKRMAGARTA